MGNAVSARLPIAFGTDAGVIPHGTNAREFERVTANAPAHPDSYRPVSVTSQMSVSLTESEK